MTCPRAHSKTVAEGHALPLHLCSSHSPHGPPVCWAASWGGENRTGQASRGQNMPDSEIDTVAVALGATEGSLAGECVWSQVPRQSLWSLQRRIRLTLGEGKGEGVRCAKDQLESGVKQDNRASLRGSVGARECPGVPWELGKVPLRRSKLSCILSEPAQFSGKSMASRVRQAWVRIPIGLSSVRDVGGSLLTREWESPS